MWSGVILVILECRITVCYKTFCQRRKRLNASVVSNRLQIVLSPNCFAFCTSLARRGVSFHIFSWFQLIILFITRSRLVLNTHNRAFEYWSKNITDLFPNMDFHDISLSCLSFGFLIFWGLSRSYEDIKQQLTHIICIQTCI